MNRKHNAFAAYCLLVLLALLPGAAHSEWLSAGRELMGTEVRVELWTEQASAGRALLDEALAEIERLDLMMNPWNPDSELTRINREAATRGVKASAEIIKVVERALYYSRLTDGAFDISFASVGQYYDFPQGKAPSERQLQQGVDNIDYRAIQLNADRGEISFTKTGLQIDLGGIAKGFAVDRAIDILRNANVSTAAVSAGGDSRLFSSGGDRPRTVGIRHPRKEGEFAVLIPLENTAISTSGDYERYFEKDGVRHHHILNPATGRSASAVQSVSILAPQAIDSDALSTAVFVLGVKKGLDLVNGLEGIDAIIIDGEGKLHYSADLLRSSPQ